MATLINKISICIVESYFLTRALLRHTLSKEESFIVTSDFEDGKLCLSAFEKPDCTKPDIVILELRVPYSNCFQTLKTLREKYPDIEVIVISNCEDEEVKLISKTLGAAEYILKDIEFSALKEIIRKIYASKNNSDIQIINS